MRIWALVTTVVLIALAGAALSTSWSVEVVIPVGVIIAAGLYLLLDAATPLGRM